MTRELKMHRGVELCQLPLRFRLHHPQVVSPTDSHPSLYLQKITKYHPRKVISLRSLGARLKPPLQKPLWNMALWILLCLSLQQINLTQYQRSRGGEMMSHWNN
uniref:Uncharacterized protein n=1 Tax=Opuntia streptacantha TaxID=393608 RepID=A0A7C9EDY1_OPUST